MYLVGGKVVFSNTRLLGHNILQGYALTSTTHDVGSGANTTLVIRSEKDCCFD